MKKLSDKILREIEAVISASESLCTLDAIRFAANTLAFFLRVFKLPPAIVEKIKGALKRLQTLEESILAADAEAVAKTIEEAEAYAPDNIPDELYDDSPDDNLNDAPSQQPSSPLPGM